MAGRSCACGGKVLPEVDSLVEGAIGPVALEALYGYVERTYNVRREQVHDNPEALIRALHTIFGRGASVLCSLVVKNARAGRAEGIEGCKLWMAIKTFYATR